MSSFTGETKTMSKFSLTNNCFPWNYPHPTDPQHIVTVTSITSHMILLQPELIPNEYKEIHGITKGGRVVEANWLEIYSFLQLSYADRIKLRCSCRMLNDVEKLISSKPKYSPLKPIPKGSYTSFPHPNHATLRGLTNRLNELPRDGSITLPSLLFIANGVYDEQGEYVNIQIPISIFGESKEGVQIIGGLYITGKKEEDVFLSDCTVTGSEDMGVYGNMGASVHLKNVCVEKCRGHGVLVTSTKRNTMTDCNINNNKYIGVYVKKGCMTIEGSATTIHQNLTSGETGWYGLQAGCDSSITLKSLKKELISTYNGLRCLSFMSYLTTGDYGGPGEIKTVTKHYGEPFKAEELSIGANLYARWKTNGTFYPGKITKIKTDGTYDIKFDDGDERKNVPLNEMLNNVTNRVSKLIQSYLDKNTKIKTDGTYNIKFDDGDEIKNVPRNKMLNMISSKMSNESKNRCVMFNNVTNRISKVIHKFWR